jgi:hypothetical protein
MIIAFYPGAGGNRFYHYLQGQTMFDPQTTYDHLLKTQKMEYRYLTSTSVGIDDQPLILTHCVNVPLLKQHWPEQTEIVVIQSDLDASLKREWTLAGQFREHDMPDPKENALGTISYHYRYYKEYPLDLTGATQIIDISNDQTDFASMMREELSLTKSDIFDQALSEYKTAQPADLADLPGDKIVDGFKSKFLDDAEKMRLRLDAVSPSMCLAKWKQVSLHLTTGLNNSCYHPPLHEIPIDAILKNPSALHNTDYKKQQRKLMLNGERPSECNYCWAMEDNGKLSDRHYRSGEPWAEKDFGKIVSSNWDDDINPSYVEVNFNSACNLTCSYCSPQFSSSWMEDVNRNGAYPTTVPHNDPGYFVGSRRPIPVREDNPYVDAFWKWWPTIYPELEHFRMTGGEPLMDKNTYRVFDYVLANPNPKLHLNVTSNFSVEKGLWEKYKTYVKRLCENDNIEHFMQYVSLDSWGDQAEYIRCGLDFNLLWDRVNEFLYEIPGKSSITFIVTMNNLSVTGFENLIPGILGLRHIYSNDYQRVWFDTPVLRTPSWQSMQLLPESYADRLELMWAWMLKKIETPETRFKGFKDYEISRLDRDIAWMRDGKQLDINYINRNKADFYKFFSEQDRRKGTNFLHAFPEMRDWWNDCRYQANQL